MSYDVTDIAELARHHLVFGAPDDETANANLARRVSELQAMATAPCGGRRPGSFATAAGPRSTPTLFTPTATTSGRRTPTKDYGTLPLRD
jgi:hypothetical protein